MPAVIDLTATGTTDWVNWACGGGPTPPALPPCQGHLPANASPYARKNVTPVIGPVAYDGTLDAGGTIPLRNLAQNSYLTTWADGDPGLIWSGDGVSHPTGTNTGGILQALSELPGGQGTSFTFEVTAISTDPHVLKFYAGNFRALGLLTVTLPGASNVTFLHTPAALELITFQIDFQANAVGDKLTVKWEDTGSNGGWSNLHLIAATLETQAVPTSTVIAYDCFDSYSATGSFVADGGAGWAESVLATGSSQSPGLTGSGQLLHDPNYQRLLDLSSPTLDPYVVLDQDGNRVIGGAGVVVWTSFYMRAGDATINTQNAIIGFHRIGTGGFHTRFGNSYTSNELIVNAGTGNGATLAGSDVSTTTHIVARWAYTGFRSGRIEVWLNPTAATESELGPANLFTPGNPSFIESFNQVQLTRGAQGIATLDVDGLVIATTYEETVATCEVLNLAPTADAGSDQSIRAGDMVFLDGSASFDDNTESAALGYSWSFFFRPTGSVATLADADTAAPSFLADVAGSYAVELVTTDTEGVVSAPDQVMVSSDNLAPTAAAGDDELVILGGGIVLDGSGSSDPEDDPLTFAWTITAAPAGSTATLSGPDLETAGLTPDIEGVYQMTLAVSDFLGAGTPDSIEITVTTAEEFAESQIVAVDEVVGALAPGQVTTAGNQNAFQNFLSQATVALQAGDAAAAISKLEKALARTDGCALRGSPDGNGSGRDWITDCAAQAEIYNLLNDALNVLLAL